MADNFEKALKDLRVELVNMKGFRAMMVKDDLVKNFDDLVNLYGLEIKPIKADYKPKKKVADYEGAIADLKNRIMAHKFKKELAKQFNEMIDNYQLAVEKINLEKK